MATACFSPASAKWRKEGNELYYQATRSVSLARCIRVGRLQDALRCYQKAMNTASTDKDAYSSSAKNYAKASLAIINFHEDDRQMQIFFYKESFEYFSKALTSGVDCKSLEWQYDISRSLGTLLKESVELCQNTVESLAERTGILETFASVISTDQLVYTDIYHHIATMWLNEASVALNERDFKRSLYSLKEMYHPMEEIRKYAQHRYDLMCELEVMDNDVYYHMARTEAMNALHTGDTLLEGHFTNEIDLNMDLIYDVIDYYHHCMVLTRGIEVELEAIAWSRLGKLYDQVLKLKTRAQPCFKTSIQLAMSLAPRNFATETWFKCATETLQRYQEETLQHQEAEREKEKQEYIKELKPELDELREKRRLMLGNDGEFLMFVYVRFPPKVTCKIPDGKRVKKMSKKELKKVFMKSVTHYHPDKQDVERFGMKWKVLSGEITKILTNIYEAYKIPE